LTLQVLADRGSQEYFEIIDIALSIKEQLAPIKAPFAKREHPEHHSIFDFSVSYDRNLSEAADRTRIDIELHLRFMCPHGDEDVSQHLRVSVSPVLEASSQRVSDGIQTNEIHGISLRYLQVLIERRVWNRLCAQNLQRCDAVRLAFLHSEEDIDTPIWPSCEDRVQLNGSIAPLLVEKPDPNHVIPEDARAHVAAVQRKLRPNPTKRTEKHGSALGLACDDRG
jgi:hypothetical protein